MSEEGQASVCVRNLAKRYGTVQALHGVSFEVQEGEIFGLLGPNGAGKTTILECLLGLRHPDSGAITVEGIDALEDSVRSRLHVGAQIQLGSVHDKLTPREALRFFGSFYADHAPVDELISRFELTEKADAPFDTLSGGQRQRLFLAIAFVNNPSLLVLDEPTAGLDAHSRRELSALISGLRAEGRTVLLSTHDMEEAQRLCDRIAILNEGRIVAVASPGELVAQSRSRPRIEVRTTRVMTEAEALAIPGVTACVVAEGACWIETADVGGLMGALMEKLGRDQNPLLDLRIYRPSLEDVFLELTGRRWSDAEGRDRK